MDLPLPHHKISAVLETQSKELSDSAVSNRTQETRFQMHAPAWEDLTLLPRLESKVHRATVPQANQFKATALLNRTLATALPSWPKATVFLSQARATALLSPARATVLLSKVSATVLVLLREATATVLPRDAPAMVALEDKAMATDHLEHLATVVMVPPRDGATPLPRDVATVLPRDVATVLPRDVATVLPRGEATPLPGVRDTLPPEGSRAMELPDMAAAVVEPLATVATTATKADMAAQESGEHGVHSIKLSV